MPSLKRLAISEMASYYRMNSQSFDQEPNRYISLVRTVESTIPTCTLSRAVIGWSEQKLKLSVDVLLEQFIESNKSTCTTSSTNTSTVEPSTNTFPRIYFLMSSSGAVGVCVNEVVGRLFDIMSSASSVDGYLIEDISSVGPMGVGCAVCAVV